jgi:hypothetical protein
MGGISGEGRTFWEATIVGGYGDMIITLIRVSRG